MKPGEFNQRRDQMRRERDSFDRMFRWLFPIALAIGVLGALTTIALYAGAAAWIWSLL